MCVGPLFVFLEGEKCFPFRLSENQRSQSIGVEYLLRHALQFVGGDAVYALGKQ